jgi:hypothetical protein
MKMRSGGSAPLVSICPVLNACACNLQIQFAPACIVASFHAFSYDDASDLSEVFVYRLFNAKDLARLGEAA